MDGFKLVVIGLPNGNKEEVLKLEQYFIDTLTPRYNILKLAGISTGYKHTEKTKSNLRKLYGTPVLVYRHSVSIISI